MAGKAAEALSRAKVRSSPTEEPSIPVTHSGEEGGFDGGGLIIML